MFARLHILYTALQKMLVCIFFNPRVTEEYIAPLGDLPRTNATCISHRPFHIYSLGSYDTPLWHALIYELKFHKSTHAANLIAPLLADALTTLSEKNVHTPPKNTPLLIPIPLSTKRLRTRGYNQVSFVLSATIPLAPHRAGCIHEDVLVRTIQREEQKTLNRTKREANVKHSFCVPEEKQSAIVGTDIILLDDVCATGATVREAARTLVHAGAASVTILVLCNS